jgi:D-amino-acid oxidase
MANKASEIKVVVLGGGVIGITTAIVLKLHGFQVTVVSKHSFDKLYSDKLSDRPAELASIHAAASVIPHSVDHPSEKEILAISQKFFHRLAFSAGFGVRVQRHYELFEKLTDPPEYARVVKDFQLLDDNGTSWAKDKSIPRRKGAPGVWGWYFNAFFAEVPTYMNALYELYKTTGGRIREGIEITSIEQIEKLEADVVVNCMGRWAVELFPDDKKNTKIIRGHMVKVGIHEVPRDERDQYFSYNYSPDPTVYSRNQNDNGEKGKFKADVYFYPRSDGWLLGGSRQVGYPDIGHPWRDEDEQISGRTIKKKNWELEVPEPIWKLNRELLLEITGVDIDEQYKGEDKYRSFSYIGYRFGRSPIRLEIGRELKTKTKLLIHNYAHGGAGYTLSWGAAYEVLKNIENILSPTIQIDRTAGMAVGYFESMKQVITDLVIEEYIQRNRNEFMPIIEE